MSPKALHSRLRRIKGVARNFKCNDCEKQALDWSNVSQKYLGIDDFVPRCRSCHTRFDGKVRNLKGKHCPKGFKHTDETKAKVSTSLIGNQRAKGFQPRLGAVLSQKTKDKIARSHRGKRLSNEHKNMIREGMKRFIQRKELSNF